MPKIAACPIDAVKNQKTIVVSTSFVRILITHRELGPPGKVIDRGRRMCCCPLTADTSADTNHGVAENDWRRATRAAGAVPGATGEGGSTKTVWA